MQIHFKNFVMAALVAVIYSAAAAQPAARVGDSTDQGGSIVLGSPNVLVNGLPLARRGDFMVSPFFVGQVPCVGGPIITGSATVLTNNLPTARRLDRGATSCGPPQIIVIGSPNVIIGP